MEFLRRKAAWTIHTLTMALVGTALYVGEDRPETQHATKEAARFMSGSTRAAKCMLKRLCKYYSEAPVLSWSFPYQEMPCEIRAVTGAIWAGKLEGLRSTSCGWTYFADYLLETCPSTQQIVALSTMESEYISTKDVAHALEIRSVLAEWDTTLNMKGKTDVTAGRAMAARRGVGRVHHLDARFSWLQRLCAESAVEVRARPGAQRGRPGIKDGRFEANDLAFERNTPSSANGLELMDGGGDSPRDCRGSERLLGIDLGREEHVRDEWLILDLRGNCDLDSVVRWTVCESHFRRPQSAEGDRQRCCVATSNEEQLKHCEKVFQIRTAWNFVVKGMRFARIVWTAARSILSVRKLGRIL